MLRWNIWASKIRVALFSESDKIVHIAAKAEGGYLNRSEISFPKIELHFCETFHSLPRIYITLAVTAIDGVAFVLCFCAKFYVSSPKLQYQSILYINYLNHKYLCASTIHGVSSHMVQIEFLDGAFQGQEGGSRGNGFNVNAKWRNCLFSENLEPLSVPQIPEGRVLVAQLLHLCHW